MEALIREEIAKSGPRTFARFMELALYHPEGGFYAVGRERVGKDGEFLTAVSMGPGLGRVLGEVVCEVWRGLGCPDVLDVIEQGAGDGRLFEDLLAGLPARMLEVVRPVIIEPIARLRQAQQRRLAGRGVRWVGSVGELGRGLCGMHFSNELVDAMPFHLAVSRAGGWRELYVGLDGGRLGWCEGPPSAPVAARVRGLEILPEGWIVEMRPAAEDWIRELAGHLSDGLVLVFDYGAVSGAGVGARNPRGTFRCYENHHMDDRPLERPGCKDITADVDFAALAVAGADAGFEVLGPVEFGRFLTRSAAPLLRRMEGRLDPGFFRNFQVLIRPEVFGARFQAFGLAAGRLRGWGLGGFLSSGARADGGGC